MHAPRINAALAAATETNPITFIIDGKRPDFRIVSTPWWILEHCGIRLWHGFLCKDRHE